MSKLYLTTFALAALSVIGIDSAVSAAQQQTKENRTVSTVSGRVTLKDEPMPGVTVSLQQQQNTLVTAAGNLLAKTDANGVYHITGVAPGRYRIRAVAAGYISNDSSQGFSGGNGRPLIVGENEALDNIDLEMKRGGVITGRITDPNGHPLVEERVNLKIVAGNSRPPANFPLGYPDLYSTDDRGVYRIYGLPEGSYLVSAGFSPESPDPYMSRNSGPLYPLTYYPDTSDQTQAKPVEVGEGAEVTGIDIVLGEAKKTYSIAGRVVLEETQQPISGVALSLGMVSPDGRVMQMWYGESARSNAGGEFRLQGVTKGKYAVVARTDEGVEGYSDPVYCEVDESDVNGIEIRIRQGGTMSGVVVIEGTNDPKVLAKLSTIQLSFSTKTEGFNGSGTSTKVGSDGSFVVGGLRPGKVTIYPYTRTITPLNFTLLRLEHDGEVQPDGITIGPGEKVANVRVVVGDNALKIHGEVKIVNGTLPKNMRLYLRANRTQQQPMGRSFTAEVDPLGRFILENLSAGEYELHVAPILTPGDPIDPHIQSAFSMAAGQKVIVSGDDQPAITITVDLNQQEGKQ